MARYCVFSLFLVTIVLTSLSCQEFENESIDVSRIKREGVPENRDLTVLLVNDQNRNDYNTKIGRYHSVKPLIGLLTSTARTFIQDGVTTEFATQILGTTLDNGRIYAQLLTKSSLVLYNKPSNVDDPYIVKPTRVHSAFDGQWNVKQDLGIIDPDKFILKNTDYLAPSSKMDIVYASKPAKESFKFWTPPSNSDNHSENQILDEPTARKAQSYEQEPKFEVYNYLDGPAIENEKRIEFGQPNIINNVNLLHRHNKAYEPETESKQDDVILNDSSIVKVKPNYDLPTFTIKNEFSPIFYYIDNVESRRSPQPSLAQTKLPKKLFGQKSEPRPKKTFTYAGFADFTTVVGDTVIIFTPNTETIRAPNPDEVNVFPSAKPVDKLSAKITFLSADIPVATSTFKAHEITTATKVPTYVSDENSSEKTSYIDEDSLNQFLYEVDNKTPDTVSIQYNNGFDLNLDVIQPSEPVFTTTESTSYTDDLEEIPIKDFNSQATDPLRSVMPSATVVEDSKESVVTDSNFRELFTNSEEEIENTAAEVTEKVQEEGEEEESQEDNSTHEVEPDIQTTTESGHSDESYEIETTTENKYNKHEEIYCSDGLETQSTMTTEYKTLTYLTTYFIPLESTETTTSIKSDVVVESNIGYITNLVCKTELDIEPTSVVSIEVQSTEESNIEPPEKVNESQSDLQHQLEIITEEPSKTTISMVKEIPTTIPKNEETFLEDDKSSGSDDNVLHTESSPSTTTERVSTSQSHIEVSVSTEHTPTENVSTDEDSENEIDLIYKTLYTTYTYFTTFFGDQTSSIASHKSVVTNIITSTVDLSKLDPSLLGVFDENDIAPTNVDVVRPTESLAINSIIDLVKNKDVIESVEIDKLYSSQTPTPTLGDDIAESIKPDSVKTYFTTYTFFTTIYVGSDANICSRNEIYTNYLGPDELIPTKSNPISTESTRAQFDFRNCKQVKGMTPQNVEENSSIETSISMKQNSLHDHKDKQTTPQPTPIEVDMLFSVESNPLISENSYVTDVKSSFSKGESKYVDSNNVLDDQISSESNIDEILPSPTLLLQTSYTTFTYFTTMYIGKDSSKVKSRLETITNVVTETITPKTEPEEENNLPITYYTTFTYWTTLYKDKSTTITSREEIVSNIVTPIPQSIPTISPIDTTPIDVVSVLPPKDLELELKPSLVDNSLEKDEGKATFYTTYTYFTTFYAGNTSQIRSSLETVTNIVDNTKLVEDNQIGRKVPSGSVDKNLIQDSDDKPHIIPTKVKEEILATKTPDPSIISSTVLQGTYIDNLFAEVNPIENNTPSSDTEKKILFSQVAVISGDSTIITADNKTVVEEPSTTPSTSTTTSTEGSIVSPTPEVIESSVTELDVTIEPLPEEDIEEDDPNTKKKGRLTFTTKKPSFTPVIIPFASRNRPTFSPKRLPVPNSATTITRADFTPTITATPTLKSVRPTGSFVGNRKPAALPGSSSPGRRFSGRSSASVNLSANIPASRAGGYPRGNISPSSRRTGPFRSSSLRSNSLDYASRSAIPRIRPTATSRLRGGRQSASILYPPAEQNESETFATQQEETATESLDEVTEFSNRQTTNNPLLRFRRPPIPRQPGTAILPRSTTPSSRRSIATRGRTTTTRRTTTRVTTNPLLSLRRQRPNSLFPRRDLFKQPDPEPEEEVGENEQRVEESEELLDEEEFEEDNDYESSDRRERQVATPVTPFLRKNSNAVQIRPFAFKRRSKRQVDYGNRKYTNFRRPGVKSASTRRPEPEPEVETPTASPKKQKSGRNTYSNSRTTGNSRTTTAAALKVSQRQPFIVRGESRSTTTSAPAYRRGKTRTSSRTTTLSSRPKAPRLSGKTTQSLRPGKTTQSSRPTGRSRSRTTTSRASSRQRNSFENLSGERFNKYDNILNDGKITITHQIPFEVTIPVVNGKITEYKNVLSAKPSIETLLLNQVSTSISPIGNQQLVLALESTELGENGATKITKFVLNETPTTTVIFTPTTIRGRKTSYSHVLPSTVYNVEPVVQTVAPEINANVPLANLLLSQLLLGNQQPAINPLLALQGQGLLPQQPVVQTPVTEYKTRTTTYVTTVTDARETVLTITFRATPILTTIVDPTTNVITATEFVTDTVVTTPTVLAPPPQYNSLLLPLLLQQQQQQAISLQTANPLLGLAQPELNLLHNNLVPNNNLNNEIFSNSPKPNILSDLSSNEDFSDDIQDSNEDFPPPSPAPKRKRTRHRAPKPAPAPPKLTSIVTLYVSGKHPGEFSTVLSTVISDDTQTVRKREALFYEDIKILPSILPSIDQLVSSQQDSLLENSIISDMDKYLANSQIVSQTETQSLESIVGKISEHVNYEASPTFVVKIANQPTIRNSNQSSIDDVSYPRFENDGSIPHFASPTASGAFNTNAIVYDNTPWRPGREFEVDLRSAEDERKVKNLATRIMSNGVEVLVRDKSAGVKQEQRKFKHMHLASSKPSNQGASSTQTHKSLLSSAVATVVNRQEISAFFPLHQLMQHNYIIKTCMTTYTYLTTVLQNKRSAVSTFETIVSVVTTESLTNLYATDVLAEIKPTKTKYMEVKTIQPSAADIYLNNVPKLDKGKDNQEEHNFDIIQPSEIGHAVCITSCTCTHSKTEILKTKYTNVKNTAVVTSDNYVMKTTKHGISPSQKDVVEKTKYRPYEYETSSQAAPTDKIVEKYTQVTDYYDDKDTNIMQTSDLLTNEQAPLPPKTKKGSSNKTENIKPERPQKVNKNKFVMAELIKLGSLGIKSLSQLAPVIEKMTGGFMKRQESNKTSTTTTTTTVKPITKVTSYNANKRVDNNLESKLGNFPIYIPVDEMETSESQIVFTNATLHQNFAWAAEHKHSKGHFVKPKIVHESPLVNGGIPISPGEVITANSDVIVGKPAVGGPLTLVASGIKLQNPVYPPPIDNVVANNQPFLTKDKISFHPTVIATKVDDSFDLRPPKLPKLKSKPNLTLLRPQDVYFGQNNGQHTSFRLPVNLHIDSEPIKNSDLNKGNNAVLINHSRPSFLDYMPTFVNPENNNPNEHSVDYRPNVETIKEINIPDNSPSSSEVINTKIPTDGHYENDDRPEFFNKPFLVDIQPSKVANVLIPHGSSTALIFAGSSEPHKTGDYIDDPLPYPEPGYFGSFSIDAPHMTNVHNVVPNKDLFLVKPNTRPSVDTLKNNLQSYKDIEISNEQKSKANEYKRPKDLNKLPPPTSNQESHIRIGPQITAYNPGLYNNHFENQNQPMVEKDVIDKEYENYLAVPPPPPKLQFSQENRYKTNPVHNHQLPVIHTKPVQDSKVFLNVQHPISNQMPPKVTSEIYFASQLPSSKPTPTYSFKIPQSATAPGSVYSKLSNLNNQPHRTSNSNHVSNSYAVSTSTTANKSVVNSNVKENMYTVTLNMATNTNDKNLGHVMGSSISVPITTTSDNGQINANIPIGTNFAIRVEDDPAKYESVALHGKRHPSLIHKEHLHVPINNIGILNLDDSSFKRNSTPSITNNKKSVINKSTNSDIYPLTLPSLNSHANFPMINEEINLHIDSNPIKNFDYDDNFKKQESIYQSVQNVTTNSHGWYSSILNEGNIKNINIDETTRKNIPLYYTGNNDSLPEFGEKITTVGKPPSWQQNKQSINNFGVGKPFSKTKTDQKPITSTLIVKPNYNPPIYGIRQPTYDIPMHDNSHETSTSRPTYIKPVKTVYETSEDIYDGEEETEISGEIDGEVSSESMSVPYVSSSNERQYNTTDFPILTLTQNIMTTAIEHKNNSVKLLQFNPGTQTEKPFASYNKTKFHLNNIKPIYNNENIYMKPRPFTINTKIPLDHQLQQPHWQINQLMENATNVSYEDNLELNVGEEVLISSTGTPVPASNSKSSLKKDNKNKMHSSFTAPTLLNSTRMVNESNIITSTVHINDKKPLTIELDKKKSMLPTLTTNTRYEINSSSSEIVDLLPPPLTLDHKYKSTKEDEIMGMSPPPPRTSFPKYPSRSTQTPRPILPNRTPPPYRTLPPRTLPPRQSTSKTVRKPISKDEVSTYRPTYENVKKIKKPALNFDQPSSHLLPPPKELPSQATPTENISKPTPAFSPTPSVIFPTSLSSKWLTSSNIEFSSSFNFAPTSVYYPESISRFEKEPDIISLQTSLDNIYDSNEFISSNETINVSYENPVTEKKITVLTQSHKTIPLEYVTSSAVDINYSNLLPSIQEDRNKNKLKVLTISNKNRTRKPYPIRNEDKKGSTNKLKLPSKTVSVIKPTRTLSRTEFSQPPRISATKKVVRPLPSRPLAVFPSSFIESSESIMEEDFIRPTEILIDDDLSTMSPEVTSFIEKTVTSTLTINQNILTTKINPTHHAGNQIKISDDILPTKTEFKTTVITLTKTLSQPPQTVSSIGYINLTQTLTVTQTETSLVSQSEGAITQTLVLTNTHTSTIVDVITEIHTQVQPTTIIETVTKHIPVPQSEATVGFNSSSNTKIALDDITMSSEDNDNFIIRDSEVTDHPIQKIETDDEKDNDTFFVVMNKSQNGGKSPPMKTDIETGDYDGVTRNEQVNNNGVSQVLFGEILLAGTPYLETTNIGRPAVIGYGKECQPDCKASRNERCQRIDGIMKCVCRPGFARMFPDRPCKPTYTYSVRLALGSQGNEELQYQKNLADNSSKEYHTLSVATHEGINRMIMQSDLRDVYHGVHINGFHPVEMKTRKGDLYQGVMNDFYVQLSDNAHESRLKEVIEKYLRNNNYSLGGTKVHAADELIDKLNVSDFDECVSTQFHDCSEHARCFNLRGTYTCSCLEGFADLSVNTLYPGRICSSDAVGCSGCNYHGTCFERESTMICECFKWYAGRTCQVNLKAVLITVTAIGAAVVLAVTIWVSKRCCCQRGPATQTFVIGCMQGMPSLHQGHPPSKQRADRRALIAERTETAETCSVQNVSLPYSPSKQSRSRSVCSKKCVISDPPAHAPPPPPAPALMIPRARLHPLHSDSRDNLSRKKSTEVCSEAKLISYLESGATNVTEEMRRKHSVESSYSINKERMNKQGALVSAGFKVSTTVRPDENSIKEDRDDASSVNKTDVEGELSRFDTLRDFNSQEDMSEWTDAERRIGELTLSEARSVGGTLPASTGRAASSTRLTHQEANTMAERDLGSTFLLPHVHLYKPDLTSDVSEFDSL